MTSEMQQRASACQDAAARGQVALRPSLQISPEKDEPFLTTYNNVHLETALADEVDRFEVSLRWRMCPQILHSPGSSPQRPAGRAALPGLVLTSSKAISLVSIFIFISI